MIRSFRDSRSRDFTLGGPNKFSGMNGARARQRLVQLHAATSLADLGKLNSVGLHKLKGDLKGFWSIDVNGPWRLLFRFDKGDAYEVHFHDPH